MTNIGQFRNHIALLSPGSIETLTVLRDGKKKKVNVTIGKVEDDTSIEEPAEEHSAAEIGLTV